MAWNRIRIRLPAIKSTLFPELFHNTLSYILSLLWTIKDNIIIFLGCILLSLCYSTSHAPIVQPPARTDDFATLLRFKRQASA